MAREYDQEINEELLRNYSGEVFLVCLVIDHPELAYPIYLVNNTQSIMSNITGSTQEYLPVAFDFKPPQSVDGEISRAQITIDNVDRTITRTLRSLTSSPYVTAYIIAASDSNEILNGPWKFQLGNVSYNRQNVSGELVYISRLEEIAGTVFFTPSNFPALYK